MTETQPFVMNSVMPNDWLIFRAIWMTWLFIRFIMLLGRIFNWFRKHAFFNLFTIQNFEKFVIWSAPVIYKILSSLEALAGCFNTILGWKYFWIQLSSAGCPNIIYYAFLELIILIFAVVDEDKSTGWTPFIGKDPT